MPDERTLSDILRDMSKTAEELTAQTFDPVKDTQDIVQEALSRVSATQESVKANLSRNSNLLQMTGFAKTQEITAFEDISKIRVPAEPVAPDPGVVASVVKEDSRADTPVVPTTPPPEERKALTPNLPITGKVEDKSSFRDSTRIEMPAVETAPHEPPQPIQPPPAEGEPAVLPGQLAAPPPVEGEKAAPANPPDLTLPEKKKTNILPKDPVPQASVDSGPVLMDPAPILPLKQEPSATFPQGGEALTRIPEEPVTPEVPVPVTTPPTETKAPKVEDIRQTVKEVPAAQQTELPVLSPVSTESALNPIPVSVPPVEGTGKPIEFSPPDTALRSPDRFTAEVLSFPDASGEDAAGPDVLPSLQPVEEQAPAPDTVPFASVDESSAGALPQQKLNLPVERRSVFPPDPGIPALPEEEAAEVPAAKRNPPPEPAAAEIDLPDFVGGPAQDQFEKTLQPPEMALLTSGRPQPAPERVFSETLTGQQAVGEAAVPLTETSGNPAERPDPVPRFENLEGPRAAFTELDLPDQVQEPSSGAVEDVRRGVKLEASASSPGSAGTSVEVLQTAAIDRAPLSDRLTEGSADLLRLPLLPNPETAPAEAAGPAPTANVSGSPAATDRNELRFGRVAGDPAVLLGTPLLDPEDLLSEPAGVPERIQSPDLDGESASPAERVPSAAISLGSATIDPRPTTGLVPAFQAAPVTPPPRGELTDRTAVDPGSPLSEAREERIAGKTEDIRFTPMEEQAAGEVPVAPATEVAASLAEETSPISLPSPAGESSAPPFEIPEVAAESRTVGEKESPNRQTAPLPTVPATESPLSLQGLSTEWAQVPETAYSGTLSETGAEDPGRVGAAPPVERSSEPPGPAGPGLLQEPPAERPRPVQIPPAVEAAAEQIASALTGLPENGESSTPPVPLPPVTGEYTQFDQEVPGTGNLTEESSETVNPVPLPPVTEEYTQFDQEVPGTGNLTEESSETVNRESFPEVTGEPAEATESVSFAPLFFEAAGTPETPNTPVQEFPDRRVVPFEATGLDAESAAAPAVIPSTERNLTEAEAVPPDRISLPEIPTVGYADSAQSGGRRQETALRDTEAGVPVTRAAESVPSPETGGDLGVLLRTLSRAGGGIAEGSRSADEQGSAGKNAWTAEILEVLSGQRGKGNTDMLAARIQAIESTLKALTT